MQKLYNKTQKYVDSVIIVFEVKFISILKRHVINHKQYFKMNIKIKNIAIIISFFTLISCNSSKSEKQLELREKELSIEKIQVINQKISTNEAIKLAEKQFENYFPTDAVFSIKESYTGDFTGDGIEDVVIHFSLDSDEGGNTSIPGLILYQNSGYDVKFIAEYKPSSLFSFDKINNGSIYVELLEFAEDDARCCPSIRTSHIITISGNNAF